MSKELDQTRAALRAALRVDYTNVLALAQDAVNAHDHTAEIKMYGGADLDVEIDKLRDALEAALNALGLEFPDSEVPSE